MLYILQAFFYLGRAKSQKELKMTLSERAVGRLFGRAAEYKIPAYALAQEANISRVTLSNWRTSSSVPSLENYLVVSEALDRMIERKVGANVS